MSTLLKVDPLPKSPFRSIEGVDYCVWSYRVSWTAAAAPSNPLALILPGSIDVLDPALYPGETAIQGCALFRSLAENRLYVSVLTPAASQLDVTISFIAPSATAATALMLAEQDATTESWNTVPFSVGAGTDLDVIQMVE